MANSPRKLGHPAEQRQVASPEATRSHPVESRPRILLADDDSAVREPVWRLLEPFYDVQAVADGRQAWAAAQQRRPDLVLSNVTMPGVDELLRRLQENQQTRDVPIILLLSDRTDKPSGDEKLREMADTYLTEPFSARKLLDCVRRYLDREQQRQPEEPRLSGPRTSDAPVSEPHAHAGEQHTRMLVAQIRDYAIFATDERGVMTTWNEGCASIFGYTRQDFIGREVAMLFTPEDHAADLPAADLRRAAEIGAAAFERWMLARDGRRFFARGSINSLRDPLGRLTGFGMAIGDFTLRKASEDQLVQRSESMARLIAERTETLDRAVKSLDLSERMASLGTIAASLGHDIGNVLLPIEVRLQILLHADLPSELREHLLGIQTTTRYLGQLSHSLQMLVAEPSAARRYNMTKLHAWWDDIGRVLCHLVSGNITFEHSLSPAECWIAISPAGLTQAMFNLVQNAVDALEGHASGHITFQAAYEPRAAWAILRVTDNGPGMTEETRRRCLEPYFSTKASAGTTGMGLSFVCNLVEDTGGRVEVESQYGHGTTVSLILPTREPPNG